jgi:hypothetical protein
MRIKLLGRMCSRKRRINSWASRLIGAAIAMSIVPVAEAHTAVLGTYQAVVGDRHLVGVAAEVVEHLLGAGERALGIHHPVVRIEVAQETPPLPRFGQARLRTEARSTSIGTPSHRHRQPHRQRTAFIGPCERARRGPRTRSSAISGEARFSGRNSVNDPACRVLVAHPFPGENLQHACSDILFLECPIVPKLFEQAVGRIYREGQKRPAVVRIAVAENTVQIRLHNLMLAKDTLARAVAGGWQDLREALYGG